MNIPVLIEPRGGNGYQARVGEPFGWVAEGSTPEEALGKLRQLVAEKIAQGSQIASLEVPAADNPWVKIAGTLKDHPLLEEWKQAMAEYRAEVERDLAEPE